MFTLQKRCSQYLHYIDSGEITDKTLEEIMSNTEHCYQVVFKKKKQILDFRDGEKLSTANEISS